MRGARGRVPPTNHDISPCDSSDSMADIPTPSTRRRRRGRPIDRPTDTRPSRGTDQQVDTAGPMSCRGLSGRGFIPRIPASSPNCVLRCSRNADLPLGGHPLSDRNQPLHQSARNPHSDFPLSRLFHVGNGPRRPTWAPTQIPVHGYDCRSRPSSLVAPKGRTRESPHKGHGVPAPGSPHSKAGRPTVTA